MDPDLFMVAGSGGHVKEPWWPEKNHRMGAANGDVFQSETLCLSNISAQLFNLFLLSQSRRVLSPLQRPYKAIVLLHIYAAYSWMSS